MIKINKKILDCLLQRFSYKTTKRIFQFSSIGCLVLLFGLPLAGLAGNGQYGWFFIGLFICSIFSSWLLTSLRDHYGLVNGDSDVLYEAENNLYKYFDNIKAGEKYIMIQPKEIYPPLKEFLEKEHYVVYYECDRYAVYEKKSKI